MSEMDKSRNSSISILFRNRDNLQKLFSIKIDYSVTRIISKSCAYITSVKTMF